MTLACRHLAGAIPAWGRAPGKKARPIAMPWDGMMVRAFSPFELFARQPGPVAQAGIVSGLWPSQNRQDANVTHSRMITEWHQARCQRPQAVSVVERVEVLTRWRASGVLPAWAPALFQSVP